MTVPGFSRGSLLAVLAALVAALVVLLVSLQGAEPAQAQADSGPDDKIIGGTPVPDGKYRFIATVRDERRGDTAREQHYCGGTLIDRNSVLTAAHCVGLPAEQLLVTVGRTVLTRDQGQTSGVAKIIPHPKFDPGSGAKFDYDVAVLQLSEPVEGITPSRLADANQNELEKPGRLLTAAGWGDTIEQNDDVFIPRRMREVQVPVVSDDAAVQAYGESFVPSLMVASGKKGKGSCQGDSGGPLFTKVDDRFTQVGIVSFNRGSTGCAAKGVPDGYTEVNSPEIRSFIVRTAK